jgi:hypothetical protein
VLVLKGIDERDSEIRRDVEFSANGRDSDSIPPENRQVWVNSCVFSRQASRDPESWREARR